MAEPLKPIGFWSYTSSDDTSSGGRLSRLRRLLADELQLLIGRRQQARIFQDVTAIPLGTDWLKEIHKALDELSFLIPIVTPAFLQSEMCCHEVMRFHQRQQELGRDDLIFPFHYIDVSHIEPDEVDDPVVLALLKRRQRFDFAPLRYRPTESEEVAKKLGALATSIRAALRRTMAPGLPLNKPEPPVQPPVPLPSGLSQPAIGRSEEDPAVTRDGPGPEMVLIPAGRFLMGVPESESEREGTNDDKARPRHLVTIARPFWLGKFPVTQGEYADFAAETGRGGASWAATEFPQDEHHPVVNVSHADALAYVAWLSGKTGQTYRLPSEAEWEYAARARTITARYWGDDAGKPGEHAHFGSKEGTRPVGSFEPNAFGLYDLLGNVWEWTADTLNSGYKGAPSDYKDAPSDGSALTLPGAAGRVIRGGCWVDKANYVRAACRVQVHFVDQYRYLGFRCARVQS